MTLFQSSIINPQHYLNPIKRFSSFFIFNPTFNLGKQSILTIQNHKLKSDSGFIFASDEEYNSLSCELYIELYYDMDYKHSNVFHEILIASSYKSESYERTYSKMQNVAADAGGLASLIIPIFQFISSFFSSHYRDQKILNKLFDFDFENDSKL